MYVCVYLIISLIILICLLYRTITNMIRHSKGLPIRKYKFIYSCLNDLDNPDDCFEILVQSIFLSAFWIIHWAVYIIYISWKRIVLPLLTRLTLSKEERVQIAIGATPNKERE